MATSTSFEQVLTEFANFIVPLTTELGGPPAAHTGRAMFDAVVPFAFLFGFNIFTIVASYYVGKLIIRTINGTVSVLITAISKASPFSPRKAAGKFRIFNHEQREHGRQRTKQNTRVIETSTEFKPWEEMSKDTVLWSFGGDLTFEVRHALNILGIDPFSTESDVRKAYLTLMKQYHPDRFMQATLQEQEWVQDTTVRIREAYDTVTSQFCRIQ